MYTLVKQNKSLIYIEKYTASLTLQSSHAEIGLTWVTHIYFLHFFLLASEILIFETLFTNL